jgi:DNA modification methylase
MIEYLQKDKQVQLVNECAEDVDFKGKKFDLVFTSPPYYTLERYTQEDNQSWKKYKQLQDWLENFLFKSLSNCWDALEDGGKMVINISDVYAKHTVNKICDPMNDFLDSLKNSKYCGCMGYQMRKRPNSKSLKGKLGRFAEPMWVWKKTK